MSSKKNKNKLLIINSEASSAEWDTFYKEVEDLVLNEDEDKDKRDKPIRLYESALREHQDQS
jgi:hypothetical protein